MNALSCFSVSMVMIEEVIKRIVLNRAQQEEHHFPSCSSPTWEVFDVYTAEVAQSILVVGGVVADDAIVLAGEVIEPAVDRRHAGQVIQHLLHIFNDFLETYRQQTELKQKHQYNKFNE